MHMDQKELDDRQNTKLAGRKGNTETKTENYRDLAGIAHTQTLSPCSTTQLRNAGRSSLLGMGDSQNSL